MLTPQDITEKVFVKAVFGGYDMTGVDNFLEGVSEDYAALYKENAILKGKLKVLVEKVEEYRSTEDAMRMALLTAQRMGEEILGDANKKRDETLLSLDNEEKARIVEMNRKIADEESRLAAAAKETAKFIEFSKAVMQKHSQFLTKLEKTRVTAAPTSAAAQPVSEEQQAEPELPSVDYSELTAAAHPEQGHEQAQESEPVPAEPLIDEDNEPTITYSIKDIERVDEPVTPRPKFDFEDLKFGTNFAEDE